MDHIAIMDKKKGLISKILSGEKKIETRWYVSRIAPWDRITVGEIVYFKDSGFPIIAKAEVMKVLQFSNLTTKKIRELLQKYWNGISPTSKTLNEACKSVQNKNYCILIFLKNPKQIKPFNINKTGFGNACAWLCVEKLGQIQERAE